MFNLVQDIRPITDLKRHTTEVLEEMRHNQRPVVLTINGKAEAVIMDVEVFQTQMQACALAKLLAEGEQDILDGKTKPARQFLKELKQRHVLSS